MRAPVRRRSPDSTRLPIRRPAPAFENAVTRLGGPPASVPCAPDVPAILPCGPAHPAATRRASIPGFRLHSTAGLAPPGALPWPARALREDAPGDTPAGGVRRTLTTGP